MNANIYRAAGAAALALCSWVHGAGKDPAAGAAAAPESGAPGTVYVKTDYMKLTDATPREYFEVELGEWRAIHEQRVRRGVTTAWYFYEMMPGARRDGDQPYDYITISVFDSYDKVVGNAGTEAIFDVYPGVKLEDLYERADRVRDFVRSDLWKLGAVTSAATRSKPAAPYLIIDYVDSRTGTGGYLELQTGVWADIHRERIRRGLLNSAAVLVLENREGEVRDYDHGAIGYYDTLGQLRVPVDPELVRAAHPGMTAAEADRALGQTEAASSTRKSQLWRLIDAIDASDLQGE